jgi:hypothetical protein
VTAHLRLPYRDKIFKEFRMPKRPGGELATRPLHFIWIADCSGSMSIDGKIQALNNAIREALPHMRTVADENPNAEVLVRALKFSSGAQWHVSQPTPIADFKWTDLTADGVTDMGHALTMLAEQLRIPHERPRPAAGAGTHLRRPADRRLQPRPAHPDERTLGQKSGPHRHRHRRGRRYRDPPEIHRPPGTQALAGQQPRGPGPHIKWVSTAVLKSASSPASQVSGIAAGLNVPIPTPPAATSGPVSADDVW